MIYATENTEKKLEYSFIAIPKKFNIYLDVNQRAMFALLIDYKQMTNNELFSISLSYICKNLDIHDNKAQKIINELIIIKCLSKKINKGQTNQYSINYQLINEFNLKSNEEIFKLREEKNVMLKKIEEEKKEKKERVKKQAAEPQQEEEHTISIETTIVTCDDELEEKIINNNNINKEKMIEKTEEKAEMKEKITEYNFNKLLEKNGLPKKMKTIVAIYDELGMSKLVDYEKKEYTENIDKYNALLSHYELI